MYFRHWKGLMKCYILKIVDEKNKTLKWNIEFVNEILKYKD
jgi:hypothetical protein